MRQRCVQSTAPPAGTGNSQGADAGGCQLPAANNTAEKAPIYRLASICAHDTHDSDSSSVNATDGADSYAPVRESDVLVVALADATRPLAALVRRAADGADARGVWQGGEVARLARHRRV
jgi:hypothetical protein